MYTKCKFFNNLFFLIIHDFQPLMMSFKVAGPFKELKGTHKNAPVRWFSRTFVIVPVGTGFCISNELLHVSNATEEQIKVS